MGITGHVRVLAQAGVAVALVAAVSGCSGNTVDSTSTPAQTVSTPTPLAASPVPTTVAPRAGMSTSPSARTGATSSGFAVAGTVDLKNPSGYTVSLKVDWSAPYPQTRVGTNPPGYTGIVVEPVQFTGEATNTTVGGRGLPNPNGRTLSSVGAGVYGIYPANSILCTRNNFGTRLANTNHYSDRTCAVHFGTVLTGARGTLLASDSIPNGVPIRYSYADLFVADPNGLRLNKVAEESATQIVAELAKPLALGIGSVWETTSSPTCKYTSSAETLSMVILSSPHGVKVPGC